MDQVLQHALAVENVEQIFKRKDGGGLEILDIYESEAGAAAEELLKKDATPAAPAVGAGVTH
jgi:hypothetical protein